MRKDVRLGAAIGGILIAVLVVYGIVISRGHSHKKTAVKLVVPENDKTASGADANGASAAADGSSIVPPATPDGSAGHEGPADLSPPPAAAVTGNGVVTPAPVETPPATANLGPAISDATPAKHSANWGALLSADNVEDYMRTRTPDPAGSDAVATDVGMTTPRTPRATDSSASETPASETPPTAGAAPDSPATATPRSYTVKSGDTLSSISRLLYGDARRYKQLLKANPKINPNRLRPGTVLTIPDKSQFQRDSATASASNAPGESSAGHSSAKSAPAPINSATEYRVQSGDNLYRISMKLYHTPNKMDLIYQFNKQLIGPDSARLKLNMVLKLPEPATRE